MSSVLPFLDSARKVIEGNADAVVSDVLDRAEKVIEGNADAVVSDVLDLAGTSVKHKIAFYNSKGKEAAAGVVDHVDNVIGGIAKTNVVTNVLYQDIARPLVKKVFGKKDEPKQAKPKEIPPEKRTIVINGTLYNLLEIVEFESTIATRKVEEIKKEDVVGLEDAKRAILECIEWPLTSPSLFRGLRQPPKGILLYGPPGTGKTMFAKAVASKCESILFCISPSNIMSKWVGEPSKNIRMAFDIARERAPSILFFDEIDGLGSKRGEGFESENARHLKTELLQQMDGLNSSDGVSKVFVIGATNLPWMLDEALLRRLEKRIYVPLPTREGRIQILQKKLEGIKFSLQLPELADRLSSYSPADITNVCRAAAMKPVFRHKEKYPGAKNLTPAHIGPITMEDFENAIENIKPSAANDDTLQGFEKFQREKGAI